jgi:lipopolysaccharide cholinephosphotransferase
MPLQIGPSASAYPQLIGFSAGLTLGLDTGRSSCVAIGLRQPRPERADVTPALPADPYVAEGLPMSQPQIHAVLIEILAAVAGICEAEGVDYVLIGGGCLGIVRHANSFVPWDNDLDISVSASDMSRLVAACRRLSPRLAVAFKDDRPNSTCKIIATDTMTCSAEGEIGPGIFIDIVPMMHWRSRRAKRLDNLISSIAGVMWTPDPPSRLRTSIKAALRGTPIPRLVRRLAERHLYPRFAEADAHCRATASGIVSGAAGRPWNGQFPHDVVFPLQTNQLNGLSVKVPNDLNRFLSLRYGSDFMTIPDASQRWQHFAHAYRRTDVR